MASTDYQYESLSSESSFRVLRLLPTEPGIDQNPAIEIELFEANFDSPPDFEAVSYAWGQEEANATVICNGKCLLVTPNVVSALKALRRSESSKVLWIDQIAIDQSSISERNMQVPKMRSIYRQATKVWVWLGVGSYEADIAFEYLLEVNEIMKAPFSESRNDLMERATELFYSEHV
jgi:hypothetical protein